MDRFDALKVWQTWLSEQGLPSFPLFGITNGVCRCKEGAACKSAGKHPRIGGCQPIRYKIEDTVIDSRRDDRLQLLT